MWIASGWRTARLLKGATPFCLLPWLAIALLVATPRQAWGLDSTRRLTQSLQRIWQVPQGLPQATILAIRQSRNGYLWLGTPSGLIRFDGVQFRMIRECAPGGAAQPWVRDLCEDRAGDLWLATEGSGLIRWHAGSAERYSNADLPAIEFHCLAAGREGGLWVGTNQGLLRINDRVVSYGKPQGLILDEVRALCEAPDGKLWIGGKGNRLCCFEGAAFTTIALKSLSADDEIAALCCGEDSTTWVGTNQGLVRLRGTDARRFTTSDGLADNSVLSLCGGQHDTVWVGTKDGFSRVHGGEIETFRGADGLSQSNVYTVFEDREGSLWVGTKHGLNQFADRRTVPFTTREGLPSNDTGPVLEDAAGRLWIGTIGGGLARFDGRHFAILTAEDGLPSNTILALANGDRGGLWVGTDLGLAHLGDGRVEKTYTTDQGLPANCINCLRRDEDGTLWVGTPAGLAELRDGKFSRPQGPATLINAPVCAIAAQRGAIVVAPREGGAIYRCAQNRADLVDGASVPAGTVDAFFEDRDGLLWMGTRGHGLYVHEPGKSRHFTMKDGLYDDEIFGIAADNDDRIWMACSNGIFYVQRSDVMKVMTGKSRSVTSTPFSPMDSLRTVECKEGVQPPICKMRDGRICFATTRGMIVIDPKRLQRSLPPIPVMVDEMIVNGQRLPLDGPHRLRPGRTNVEFSYTALSLVSPARISFRYKLDGFDKDWVEAGTRRQAFYTNLLPGSYQFRVAAANQDGHFQLASQGIRFTLRPYLYQRIWFFPACGLLVVLVGWAAYRMRVRRIKGQLRAVMAERSRIARELHDTLMQGFSGVTMQMQALLTRLPASTEKKTLAEIIQDAAMCLREARRSVAGLRQDSGSGSGLETSIEQAARQLTEMRELDARVNVQRLANRLPAEVEYNLLRIAQEAMSNVVKHAKARVLEVELLETKEKIRLTVRDDGIGMVGQNGQALDQGHYGLLGMRERASQIGADLKIESVPGQGTTVTVALPVTACSETLPSGPRAITGEA